MAIVRVAAAVILRRRRPRAARAAPAGKAYAGYWEFPGGKLEPGRSRRATRSSASCAEELGLHVRRAAPWLVQRFVYPHAHVELHFFRVFEWDGEPVGHDGQAFAWQMPGASTSRRCCPPIRSCCARSCCPPCTASRWPRTWAKPAFLARARAALERGLRLIQLREKDWPAARQRALGDALLALAHAHGASVLLNGATENARAWGCDGVHWTSAALAQATARPADLMCAASCHTREEIAKAGALALDFAVLGPVRPTPTHPGAVTLGWDGFGGGRGRRVAGVRAGGIDGGDLDAAIVHGAHGVALRRAAWA